MSDLDSNRYYGKISKLTKTFNKMDMKQLASGMNNIRKTNEKIVEDVER